MKGPNSCTLNFAQTRIALTFLPDSPTLHVCMCVYVFVYLRWSFRPVHTLAYSHGVGMHVLSVLQTSQWLRVHYIIWSEQHKNQSKPPHSYMVVHTESRVTNVILNNLSFTFFSHAYVWKITVSKFLVLSHRPAWRKNDCFLTLTTYTNTERWLHHFLIPTENWFHLLMS